MDFSLANLTISEFNYFDAVIGAIILILGVKGFISGFIKEAFGLVGLIGGVYFASRLSDKAAGFIEANLVKVDNPALVKLAGFMAILLLVWVGMTLLGQIIHKLTAVSGLGFLNRLLGLVVGAGKYFVIFALIVTALSNVSLIKDKLNKYVADSQLYPFLAETGAYLINLDPATFDLIKTNNSPAETNTSVNSPKIVESNTTKTN